MEENDRAAGLQFNLSEKDITEVNPARSALRHRIDKVWAERRPGQPMPDFAKKMVDDVAQDYLSEHGVPEEPGHLEHLETQLSAVEQKVRDSVATGARMTDSEWKEVVNDQLRAVADDDPFLSHSGASRANACDSGLMVQRAVRMF